MRTETLVESKPGLLTLTSHQASTLSRLGERLASKKGYWGSSDDDDTEPNRSVISCTSAGNRWKVTVREMVGVIQIPDVQIEIRPKIPLDHFLHLAAWSQHVPRLDEQRASIASGANLWELLARWFVSRLSEVLRADLIRDYRSETDELAVASGRVLVMPTARAYYAGRVALTCEYQVFDADTPQNRVLKAAATAVVGTPASPASLRREARQLLTAMNDVGRLRHGDIDAQIDQRASHYQDAYTLARQLLTRQLRDPRHGDQTGWAFLLPTPDFVEKGIRNLLSARLAPIEVTNRLLSLPGSRVTLHPDLVFAGGRAVGDIKYKLHDGTWNRPDLYQATTFATGYRNTNAAIVSFDDRTNDQRAADLRIGDVTLTTICWPCNAYVTPTEAANTLVNDCTAWLAHVIDDTHLALHGKRSSRCVNQPTSTTPS